MTDKSLEILQLAGVYADLCVEYALACAKGEPAMFELEKCGKVWQRLVGIVEGEDPPATAPQHHIPGLDQTVWEGK